MLRTSAVIKQLKLIDQVRLIYYGRVITRRDSDPPGFLRLAGHPLRWRLLAELAGSDRQVRELTALAGQRQSLVSYHLGQLRAGGLVYGHHPSQVPRDLF